MTTTCKMACACMFGLIVGQAEAQEKADNAIGRFQAFTGSETRDKDEGTEDPGVWLLDTLTGRLAFCQSGLINMVKTDDGYMIGEPRVSCTPWKYPEPDDDPLGIRDTLK